jgi:hypothetical protein
MFENCGPRHGFSAGIDRRSFLRVGALGLGGVGALGLGDILRLRAESPAKAAPRAVIMVCLAGGPSHLETYDMKPNAPEDIRGEFKPIRTNVSGFEVCQHMPHQAQIADKLALVRTVQFVEPMQHELEEVYTGFPKSAKRPSFGSVISRFRGSRSELPSYVSLEYAEGTVNYESPQYLGAAHRPLHVAGMAGVHNLSLPYYMTRQKLNDRRGLLKAFERYRREVDYRRESQDMDAYTAKAFDIVTSGKARKAFDLSLEPGKLREKYGNSDDKYTYVDPKNDSIWDSQKFLLARRLVEAGVPVVTLRAGLWDHHGNVVSTFGSTLWKGMKTMLPLLDRSIHALVTDLHDRGLGREVAVLVWGEFGRTPKIVQSGRDHWPETGFALFAGGGLKTGQVIGATDSRGERPKQKPLSAQNVLATVYHLLGIDAKRTIPDFTGRPQHILDDARPIEELVA